MLPTIFGFNWVDAIILILLSIVLYEAVKTGFWLIFANFISILITLLLSLRLYPYLANILKVNFGLNKSMSNATGFLILAVLTEILFGFLAIWIVSKIPEKYKNSKYLLPLTLISGTGEVLLLASFFLTLLISIPISPMIKLEINNSKLGGVLIRSTSFAERRLYDVFGGLSTESLTHLVISPESMESVALSVDNLHLMPDEKAEMELYDLVNRERGIAGLAEFEWNENLVNIARRHASDMWTRKYFSHYSPEGNNAGDRLEAGGVNYYLAGENLALADSVDTAHQGLMNSEGHRANILSPNFKKIGIGVVDNIQYGKLFVQIFTD